MSLTIAQRIELARQGSNPNVISRLEAGWVIGFDDQLTHGYCLLMSDPIVKTLNELDESRRLIYLRDMARVGDAILSATGAARINYETWCNKDQSLHTHIVPRYLDEPEDKRYLPVCKAYEAANARKFSPQLDELFVRKMQAYLNQFA
jgi:diadenosine tetraphosphate (Ap4A) HIT family hydrolase